MSAVNQSDAAFDFPGRPCMQLPPELLASPAQTPSLNRAIRAQALLEQVSPRTWVAQSLKEGFKHHIQFWWRPIAHLAGTIF
jgi:hypothetical protein